MPPTRLLKRPARLIPIVLLLIVLPVIQQITAQPDDSVMGIFEGITPCSAADRPLPQIPEDTECEMTIWKITLYQNPKTGEPARYELHAAYGMSQPNTTGLQNGGTIIQLEGVWTILQGAASSPDAVVYQLNPDVSAASGYFIKLDDNLLHVLSPDKRMLVGNGGWSYTLNRVDKRIQTKPAESVPATTAEPELLPEAPGEFSVVEVYEGRLPCNEVTYQFTRVTPAPNCVKIKMRLTMYRDPDTGGPTTYVLETVDTAREGLRAFYEKAWTETRGTPAQPNGVVYRLALDTPEAFTAFLHPDENHLYLLDGDFNLLVGDRLWSYTLSRVPARIEG